MRTLFVLVCTTLVACGHGATAPSPEPVGPVLPPFTEEQPVPDTPYVELMVSQQVLTHRRVVPYLHLEIPENVPLRLWVGADLAAGAPELQAAGEPVQLVKEADARLVLDSRTRVDGHTWRVYWRIPPENVAGHVDVEFRRGIWTAVSGTANIRP